MTGTYQVPPTRMMRDGRDMDLYQARQEMAISGHAMGLCDIYGRSWPASVSIGESRNGSWMSSKDKIVSGYKFNMCLENTASKNYCTEKIWDPIRNGCLPVYSSSENGIYDLFPVGSFVDVEEFDSVEDIFRYLDVMDWEEWSRRYDLCRDAYLMAKYRYVEEGLADQVVDRFLERLEASVF